MDERRVKRRVGAVAALTFLLIAVLVAYNTGASLDVGRSRYTVQIQAPRAPGVGTNTPVRRDGILVGRVESTEPVPGGVLIKARVSRDNPILESDRAMIRPSSLFGDAVIEFTSAPLAPPQPANPQPANPQAGNPQPPNLQLPPPQPADPQTSREPVSPDQVIQAEVAPDPIAALTELQVEVQPAIQSLGEAGDAMTELANKLNAALGDDISPDRLENLLANVENAVTQLNTTLSSVNAVVGDQTTQDRTREALNELPQLLTSLRRAADTADGAFQALDSAVSSADTNLRNLEGLTQPLGERGQEIAQNVISASENLDLVLADAQRFAASLNNGQGSLGRVVNDPELYNNLNDAVKRANQLLWRADGLAKQLRPILGDVRVFTDRVSRNPGRIITDAVKPGPGIK